MSEKKTAKDLRVILRRDSLGTVYSEVVDMNNRPEWSLAPIGVVIDRARGRGMPPETVKHRAESMAKLLGIPFDEDLSWPCSAARKLACHCPKCVERRGFA